MITNRLESLITPEWTHRQYELYGGALTPEVSFIMAVDTLVVPERVYFRATFH
ncbi:MAG: hypothetical protein ABIQ18_29785 [Umezawaea sp.]